MHRASHNHVIPSKARNPNWHNIKIILAGISRRSLQRAYRSHWFELRLAPAGMLAFMLHRLSGIGLVVYLFLHLAVLSLLSGGPQNWDRFLAAVKSPLFTILDGILLFGILFHGLNGLRVTIIGLKRGLRWQKVSFWVILGLSILLTLSGTALFVVR